VSIVRDSKKTSDHAEAVTLHQLPTSLEGCEVAGMHRAERAAEYDDRWLRASHCRRCCHKC